MRALLDTYTYRSGDIRTSVPDFTRTPISALDALSYATLEHTDRQPLAVIVTKDVCVFVPVLRLTPAPPHDVRNVYIVLAPTDQQPPAATMAGKIRTLSPRFQERLLGEQGWGLRGRRGECGSSHEGGHRCLFLVFLFCFFSCHVVRKYSECFVIYMALPKMSLLSRTDLIRGYLAYGRLCRYQVRGCYDNRVYQALSGWKPIIIVMKPTKSPIEGQPNPRKGNIVSGAIMRV